MIFLLLRLPGSETCVENKVASARRYLVGFKGVSPALAVFMPH
ncbi:MAG: hypothetical protein R8K49_09130 [Mariprofundaceae bacterium]